MATWHRAADPVLNCDIESLAATQGRVMRVHTPTDAPTTLTAAVAAASDPSADEGGSVVTVVFPHDVSWQPAVAGERGRGPAGQSCAGAVSGNPQRATRGNTPFGGSGVCCSAGAAAAGASENVAALGQQGSRGDHEQVGSGGAAGCGQLGAAGGKLLEDEGAKAFIRACAQVSGPTNSITGFNSISSLCMQVDRHLCQKHQQAAIPWSQTVQLAGPKAGRGPEQGGHSAGRTCHP